MADRSKNSRYEQLYTQLLERGEMLHENNKKRIKHGLILLAILPVLVVYIILSKSIIKGVTAGSVKG